MFKIQESAMVELTDNLLRLMAYFGLAMFVIWLFAAAQGKPWLASVEPAKQPHNQLGQGGKWNHESKTGPRNEQAWQTAVGMAVSG